MNRFDSNGPSGRPAPLARRLAVSVLALGAMLALAAQADNGADAANAVNTANAQVPSAAQSRSPAPSSSKAPAQWTRAANKHNGSGIRLRYSVPTALQAGAPASVQLQFSGVTEDGASVALRAPDGAALVAEDGAPVNRVALPAGQVTTLVLRIVPAADGQQTLDVFTAQAGRRSAQSVPLKVGSGAVKLQPNGKARSMPSGERVISLPAESPTQ